MWKLTSFLGILALCISACGNGKKATNDGAADNKIISITHGTSFGMCRGYCTKEEYYTIDTLIESQRSPDTARYKEKISGKSFKVADFNDLCAAVDLKKWNALEERIGCPDCADRGSEYVIITTKEGTKTVVFDAHTDVPGLTELLTKLRAKRKELEKVPNMESE